MPKQRNAFKLGLTLIVFGVLLIGVLVYLAPAGGGDLVLRVRFPHDKVGAALKQGGEVVCGGMVVGGIRDVELLELPVVTTQPAEEAAEETADAPDTEELCSVVTIGIDSRVGLRTDCTIATEGTLLGGIGRLVIVNRGEGDPVKRNAMIVGLPASSISAALRSLASELDSEDPASLLVALKAQFDGTDETTLLGKLFVSLDNVAEATARIRDELDREQQATMLGKLHVMLDAFNRGIETLVALIEENREPITDTITNVHETSEILEQQIAARIAMQLDPAEPAAMIAKIHVSIDRLGQALDDIHAITSQGRETVGLSNEQVIRIVANIKETTDHLKAAGKEIRHSPWRLLYQPSLEEAAEANVFDAARAFSEAATRLDDAATQLKSAAELGIPTDEDDTRLLLILGELERTFEQFNEVETALWHQLDIK
jgi:hypothetical protein